SHPPPTLHISFFTHPPTTQLYTLSLHDALPISHSWITKPLRSNSNRMSSASTPTISSRIGIATLSASSLSTARLAIPILEEIVGDRKSTRLNSSHDQISYAVFCLKKKK